LALAVAASAIGAVPSEECDEDLCCSNSLQLARWYQARTADRRAGTRKTMIVALARKLLIALWRFVTTGETLEGVVLRPAG